MQLLSIGDAMSRYEGNTLRKIAETMAGSGDYSSIWLLNDKDGITPASGGYTHFLCATPADATRDVVSFLMKPNVSNDTRMYGDGQIQKLVMEELDLIIDRDRVSAAETPEPPAATSPSPMPSWYLADDESKHARQLVLTLPVEAAVPPRVSNLMAGFAFMEPNWAVTLLQMVGNSAQTEGPFVFAKATGVIDLVKDQPATLACSFYRMDRGGLFQMFVEVDTPQIREKAGGSPFLAEISYWPDEEDDRHLVEGLIGLDELELCFVAPGDNGPCTGYFGLRVELPEEVKTMLRWEWDNLLAFHSEVSGRDYRAALDQYNRENPITGNPILQPSRQQSRETGPRETQTRPPAQHKRWWEFWK
jgi:hypothetical protein